MKALSRIDLVARLKTALRKASTLDDLLQKEPVPATFAARTTAFVITKTAASFERSSLMADFSAENVRSRSKPSPNDLISLADDRPIPDSLTIRCRNNELRRRPLQQIVTEGKPKPPVIPGVPDHHPSLKVAVEVN
jgi:hypothetical protein